METTPQSVRPKRRLSPDQLSHNGQTSKKGQTPGGSMTSFTTGSTAASSAADAVTIDANLPTQDEVTDDAIKAAPRRYAIDLQGSPTIHLRLQSPNMSTETNPPEVVSGK